MPTVRLVNPRRNRTRKARRRRAARNPAEIVLMGNPIRRRTYVAKKRRKRNVRRRHGRKHNPLLAKATRHHRRRRSNVRHTRRRRNPLALALPVRELMPTALYAIGGGVAARAIPQLVLKDKNTGIFGYGANALTTVVLSMLLGKFVGKNASVGALLGGTVMTVGRIIAEQFGKSVVEFQSLLGAGDPSFDLRGLGLYQPNYFAVPTISRGGLQVTSPPMAALPAAHGISGLGDNARFRSRYAA